MICSFPTRMPSFIGAIAGAQRSFVLHTGYSAGHYRTTAVSQIHRHRAWQDFAHLYSPRLYIVSID